MHSVQDLFHVAVGIGVGSWDISFSAVVKSLARHASSCMEEKNSPREVLIEALMCSAQRETYCIKLVGKGVISL